ncbi:hypothetical protein BN1058_00057 [Paraliobacillus sp. PM-2]|uniref:DUF4003 family protein n=1 Tax=Paraliobacillus sp. PM-2 TaxID=1462524 RepID=UPI00061CBFBE|nr:DUF4003 family protein [Paraliobacillus sp. PM-2]CQR45819.1 hypothetical protein BN1058_00057 [Paraliobacillus sp. PM-2]
MHLATLNEKISTFETIYKQLQDKLKWKFSDKRILMVIASTYVLNCRNFQLDQFLDISNYIKKHVGAFSTLKSYQRFTTASMLDVRFQNPKEEFHQFIDIYEQLIRGGFSRGSFTYIAAMAIMTNPSEESYDKERVGRSLDIYREMKKHHFFLTSSSDYPLAALLSGINVEINHLINRTESLYESLSNKGFKKGNDLQFLTHILTLHPSISEDTLVNRSTKQLVAFKKNGVKIKKMHYPEIGMLALLEDTSGFIERIKVVTEQLNDLKGFKWTKDFNLIFAINFVMSEVIEDKTLLEAGLHTVMEAIMQAQQAAMIAAVAGASAATSSAANS